MTNDELKRQAIISHRISLNRAWSFESAQTDHLKLVRRFNDPTGLEQKQQVWLELQWSPEVELFGLSINEIQLVLPENIDAGQSNSHRWLIGDYLRGNNLVVLDLRSTLISEVTRIQSRRLIELQPSCSVVLDISEPS